MISGLNITGIVVIDAPNVTIQNCSITGATQTGVVQIASGVTGAAVQNCTINGNGSNNDGSNGIEGQGTFVGNNISSCQKPSLAGVTVKQKGASWLILDAEFFARRTSSTTTRPRVQKPWSSSRRGWRNFAHR